MKKKYFEELIKIANSDNNFILDNTFLPSHAVMPSTQKFDENIKHLWQTNLLEIAEKKFPPINIKDQKTIDLLHETCAKIVNLEMYVRKNYPSIKIEPNFLALDDGDRKLFPKNSKQKMFTDEQILNDNDIFFRVRFKLESYFFQQSEKDQEEELYAPIYALMHLWKYEHQIFWRQTKEKLQTSIKFTVDPDTPDNHLSQKEIDALSVDVPLLLPYKRCVIEILEPQPLGEKNAESLFYILLEQKDDLIFDNEEAFKDTTWKSNLKGGIRFMIFCKASGNFYEKGFRQKWCTDHIWYELQWLNRHTVKDGMIPLNDENHGYRYQIAENQPILNGDYIDSSGNQNEEYGNQSLNDWVNFANAKIFKFLCLLHYPAICDQKKIKGVAPIIKNAVKDLKHSTLLKAPTWEHKTLKLNLRDEIYQSEEGSGKTSKRFHSVRAHIRKCSTGKITWVRSHFRGDAKLGGITKDYKIQNAI